jgi:multiple sugar transport system substrate-binding protein
MIFQHIRRATVAATVAAVGITVAAIGLGSPSWAQSDKPVTLVIANSQWLDALRGKKLWEAVLEYQKVAPNVTLHQEAIPGAQFSDKITTELGAGQGADLVIMQDDLFFAIADAGILVPLDDVTKGATGLNHTNDGGVIKGTRLGIGWHRAPYALIYNKRILAELGLKAPTNFDELLAAAKAATAKGYVGFIGRHLMNDFATWFKDFENWAYGYGANWVDAKGKVTVNTPEAAAAVAAFKAMYDAKVMPIGDDIIAQRGRFKENRVALGLENSGSSLNIATGGALASADLGAAPLPFPNPGAHQQIFISVNKNSKNQDAAKAFLKWLITPAGQQSLRNASGPDALATDVPVTDEFKTANPWAVTFAQVATTSRSLLIPGHEVQTADIMRYVMEAVEKVLIRGANPKDALAEAQKQIDAKF